MSLRIEDYALIGDLQTAALVGKDGSIDWLCLPSFDSSSCFSALLGGPEHGRWLLSPQQKVTSSRRYYRGDTLILITEFETASGAVRLIDSMPPRHTHPHLVRVVEGIRGTVEMAMTLTLRFDYGVTIPWVRDRGDALEAIAGPNAICLRTSVSTRGKDFNTVADFTVNAGDKIPFVLTWYPSHLETPAPLEACQSIKRTEEWWKEWASHCTYQGPWRDAVIRSLITLKALTFAPTGGIVAAPTTSLPEWIGGVRNWDYRYCWLRDATFTLMALMGAGYHQEANQWRDWLLRAVAGDPAKLQILYGPSGERRIDEYIIPGLPGYEGSSPVRIGNAAVNQLQLDVYGEVLDALYQSQRIQNAVNEDGWALQRAILEFLEQAWAQPDEGIWEVRGPRRAFCHSKMLTWVAMDRGVKSAEQWNLRGSVEAWRAVRDQIHAQVCRQGFDPARNTFTQYYGSKEIDASLLQMALVGFLPPTDSRVIGTVKTIENELLRDGLVMRYNTTASKEVDGLPSGEGAFLPCSFWLADNYALMNRRDESEALFERLLGLRNDVGLLAEEYDPVGKRLLGNFPQAFSHVSLVNTALNLSGSLAPAMNRHRT